MNFHAARDVGCRRDVLIGGDLPCQKLRGASLLAHTQTIIQNKILKNDLNLGIIRLGGTLSQMV